MSVASGLELEFRDDAVAVLWLDDPSEPVNTLKQELAEAFAEALSRLKGHLGLKGLVLASRKPDNFLAGADLTMVQGVKSAAEGAQLSRTLHRLQQDLLGLGVPTVAAIHGACLGGGVELALACNGRVASDHDKTRLGLPEVQLGLLPGGGGTQRLPRLIGVEAALDLMLTGRQLDPRRALGLGLVDEVVRPEILLSVAVERVLGAHARGRKPGLVARLRRGLLNRTGLGRRLVFDQARKRTLARTLGNYPAPERILEVVRLGLEQGLEAGLEAEARGFGELAVTQESRQLVNLFFAITALKKDPGVDVEDVAPRPVKRVGVLGGGLMGAGIAQVTADRAGLPVRLKERDADAVGRGLRQVYGGLQQRLRRRRIDPLERDRVMARLSGGTDYAGFGRLDLVIEAVFEDLELKQRILRQVEAVCATDTIFASNTSALPIRAIAEASARPAQVIGMHYFSPVQRMQLLEVITTEHTAPWVTATCVALGKRQGKTVIVVGDGPGFYTTRILTPYLNEASHLLLEGVAVDLIDRALEGFGFPLGPLRLLDEVGIDVGEKVGHTLHQALGERLRPPDGIQRLREDGRLGRKNGRGLYRYDGIKKARRAVDERIYALLGVTPDRHMGAEEITERCALLMVNEALHCLGEGVLRNPRDGDVGAVLGLGFPPFRGGPFRYLERQGAVWVLERLQHYQQRHGPRFAPAPRLREMALGKH